jgi:hypothetical protein
MRAHVSTTAHTAPAGATPLRRHPETVAACTAAAAAAGGHPGAGTGHTVAGAGCNYRRSLSAARDFAGRMVRWLRMRPVHVATVEMASSCCAAVAGSLGLSHCCSMTRRCLGVPRVADCGAAGTTMPVTGHCMSHHDPSWSSHSLGRAIPS